MRGILLFRTAAGEIARLDGERSARRALIRMLEEEAPEGAEVLGLVIDVDATPHLALVGA
ncbi:hypothetical protein AX769_14020 [Frondihabitans sp. PAMC 28766]|uniref:hypothetical protein n=1 Tax=Frondihabitans sp. PAMC 28766 TaxID=1795630 RepID=UPI00078DF7EF|nr:hypothetical protein [Frondihabitans sp. PAMC 28766]AMM21050.1 hypothetical protein AX769_14020 [Frondihabitans sp. PAMC 28766]